MIALQIIAVTLLAGLVIYPFKVEADRLAHKRRIERRNREFKNRKH